MWVKRKQIALCGHLGYDDTRDNGVVRKKITAGEDIMSGALHCNGSRPSNESCCAHLYPSTSSSESTIPYAKCEYLNIRF